MASSILYPPKTPAAGGRGEEAVSRDGLAALWQLYEDVALADGAGLPPRLTQAFLLLTAPWWLVAAHATTPPSIRGYS